MYLIIFKNMALPYSRPHCEPSTPAVRIKVLERIDRYFEDHKLQNKIGKQELASLPKGEGQGQIHPVR